MSRYSLWLIPKGEGYKAFSEIINQLSTKYSLPKFEPHITLLGGFGMDEEEAISKTNKLAALLTPYLSLAYGVYSNLSEEQKKRMIEQVGTNYPKTLEFDTVSLFNIDDKNE